MKNFVAQYDQAMATDNSSNENLRYIPMTQAPFRVSGFAFTGKDGSLRRLPENPGFSPGVSGLSEYTAGGRIDFCSDTKRIWVKVKLKNPSHMDHMPDTGSCGCDLYIGKPGQSVMLGTSRFPAGANEYESRMHNYELPGKMEHFTINMPLYSAVEYLLIGIDHDARLLPPAPFADDKPLVIYGSSITQGGCASRPGMAYPAILGRRLNLPVLNLGFSGNGKGEAIVAEHLAMIDDPACYILDYEPNALPAGIRNTLEKFIGILRKKHPLTPIFVLSSLRFNREIPVSGSPDIQVKLLSDSAKFQHSVVRKRQQDGDKNIHFIHGGKIMGKYWHEFSVDGCHQTDLGFFIIAGKLEKILKKYL